MKITADSLATFNAEGQLASFRYLYVIAGDCLYLPHGSLVCEKATGSHNTSIRVASMLVRKHHQMALDFMKIMYIPNAPRLVYMFFAFPFFFNSALEVEAIHSYHQQMKI